jgi:hypothetical protein
MLDAIYLNCWNEIGREDFIKKLWGAFRLNYRTVQALLSLDAFVLLELYERALLPENLLLPSDFDFPGDLCVEDGASGVNFLFEEAIANIDRSTLAAFLKQYRNRIAG